MYPIVIDETALASDIGRQGWSRIKLLDPPDCAALAALYGQDRHFRSTISMQRHNFGRGEYRYFAYPLPPAIQAMRTALYRPLASIANAWAMAADFPASHEDYVAQCHRAGQTRPTPLLLRYGPGDYNCLHQDLYGALAFPFQATVLLSSPGTDFTGGEFVLVEQRPRAQSCAEVIALAQGEAVIFPVNRRVSFQSGTARRTVMRHGVSRVDHGLRHTLGIIFHDAA
ncbi:MAG: 2OG-Fe(II) oxygenase [Proteobacteria bacterium]|nr:2OG-Fe(II) oxygenase [Pseudomonadota bacterium]